MKKIKEYYWHSAKKTTRMSHLLGIFLAVMVMMIAGEARGQDQIDLMNSFPPSPEAAELGKYGEIESNLYEGKANITVPIFQFSINGFTLPITLDYTTSAIRVDQIATNIGLGWTLNAGGIITQTVNGLPDLTETRPIPEDPSDFKPNDPDSLDDYELAEDILAGLVDMESDNFVYSFPGKSGKFIFSNDGTEIHTIPYEDIVITETNNTFEIIDDDGTKYTFDVGSSVYYEDSCEGGSGDPVNRFPFTGISNLLSKITTTNGNVIELEYESYQYEYESIIDQAYYKQSGSLNCPSLASLDKTCTRTNSANEKRLSKISSPQNDTEVHFVYDDSGREDLVGADRLEKIVIIEGTDTLKTYNLVHSYFYSPGYNGSAPVSIKELNTRLKLDSVYVEGLPGWGFDYNESIDMPARDSYAVDHWGHYNGETSNTTFIPEHATYYPNGAERDPDVTKIYTGILERVNYPTGGYTELEYGTTSNTSAIRVDKIISKESPSGESIIKEFEYVSGFASGTPNYIANYDIEVENAEGQYETCTYKLMTSTPVLPFGGSANSIGHSKVIEKLGTDGVFGQTEYTFTTGTSSLSDSSYTNRSASEPAYSWTGGKLLKQEAKEHVSGSTFKKNQSTINTYRLYHDSNGAYNDDPKFPGKHENYIFDIKVHVETSEKQSGFLYIPSTYQVEVLRNISAWYHPKTTTVQVYDKTGTNYSESVTEFNHDEPTHILLSEKVETNSDGSERITKYRYAHEEYASMADSNMLSQPYSVTVENSSGHVLSRNWTTWNNSISGNNNWNVLAQWQWEGSSDSDTGAPEDPTSEAVKIAEVTKYDSYGNVLEVKDALDLKTAYQWSDDKQVPVGIFSNADVDEVYAHSFAYDSLTNWIPGDRFNDNDTEFEIENGKLKITNHDSAADQELDYLGFNFGSELTGNIVWEFDIKIDDSNGSDLQMNAGGSSWNYYGATSNLENAIWSAIKNEDWRTHDGAGWVTINKTKLTVGEVYSFKIVMYPSTNKADYYINGSLLESDVNFRFPSSGIQKLAFGNYGYGTVTTEWYIDNVRIYPENAQAQSREVDPVFKNTLSVKDVSGSTNRFSYDALGRLKEVFNPNGERISRNSYFYSLDSHSSFDEDDPNRIETITYNDPADTTDKTLTVTYLDGLGRPIQNQIRAADGNAIITGTLYDEKGRPHITSRPIKLDVDSYTNGFVNDLWGTGFDGDPGEALPSDSKIPAYHADSLGITTSDTSYAYTQTQFEASPLNRPIASGNAASALRIGQNESLMSYGLNSGSEDFSGFTDNELTKSVSTDPNGNHTFSFTDGWGNTIASMVDMDGDSTKDSGDLVTQFQYDLRNQLKKVTDPRGLVTDYKYNQRGQLTEQDMPDKDDPDNYRYDKNGNLRFVQHANHKADLTDESQSLTGGTSVTKTVSAGIRGELSFNFSWVDLYLGNYTITIKRTEDNTVIYSNTLNAEYGSISTQTFDVEGGTYEFKGQAQDPGDIVSTAGTFAFKPYKFTYNNYDELNRITETGEYYGDSTFTDKSAGIDVSGSKAPMQKFHYGEANAKSGASNTKGRLVKAEYRDMNTNEWGTTWYSYNTQGLVEWIVQDLPGSTMGEKTIEYTYDELGRVTEMNYQPGESDDYYFRYTYDDLGRLAKTESRNSSGGSWLEDAEYTYLADGQLSDLQLGNTAQNIDYIYGSEGWLDAINNPGTLGTDRFGQTLSYNHNGNISSTTWNQSMNSGTKTYNFTYDAANRLTDANQSSGTAWDVDYIYDKNGNLVTYERRNQSGSTGTTGDMAIIHETGKNRINYLEEVNTLVNYDISYDANGNMIKNELNGLENASYDSRNLPYKLTVNGTSQYSVYDTDGQRVKQSFDGTDTYYIRDASGQTIAVYEGGTLAHINLLSAGNIIGIAPSAGSKEYFLKDHLGSVRATVNTSGTEVSYKDYYPYGKTMPGRFSGSTRYQFTGHERDSLSSGSSISYAGARLLDSDSPGWLSIDPLAYFSPNLSPYQYSRSNPIRFLDPDGRKEYDCTDWSASEIDENIGQGDWCKSDRENNTSRWSEANEYNLRHGRSGEYTTIAQRADFYNWFQGYANGMGLNIRWAGAASAVASGISHLTDSRLIGTRFSNDHASNFAQVGNRMIFQNVFGKLQALTNGGAGEFGLISAYAWDAIILAEEQSLIQPLYENTHAFGILNSNAKLSFLYFNASKSLVSRFMTGIPPFSGNGNLNSVNDRWAYGMRNMGYNVKPEDMPSPSSDYQDGVLYRQLRNAGAGGKW